jgi:hypothetical protein
VAQVVEHLPSKVKAMSSTPSTANDNYNNFKTNASSSLRAKKKIRIT